MKNTLLELKPIQYGTSATKTLHINVPPHTRCFRLHWHDGMEILRIKSGKLYLVHGTDLITVSPGELVIIPPKMLHQGYTLNNSVEYDVLMFDIRSFYNDTEICNKLLPVIFEGEAIFKAITSDIQTISCMDSICNSDDLGTLEIISKIYQLLYLFCKNDILKLQIHTKDSIVKKVITYLEENSSQEISIPVLCEKFGYTSAHLCRKFKKATGLPPMTYLKIYRLELAYKKLKNSDTTISNIATECGFPNANYFTRCFKKHFGFPPTKYIKNQAGTEYMKSDF